MISLCFLLLIKRSVSTLQTSAIIRMKRCRKMKMTHGFGRFMLNSIHLFFMHILKYLPKTKPARKSFDFAEVKKSPFWSREDAVKADVTDVSNAAMLRWLLPRRRGVRVRLVKKKKVRTARWEAETKFHDASQKYTVQFVSMKQQRYFKWDNFEHDIWTFSGCVCGDKTRYSKLKPDLFLSLTVVCV